MWVTDRKKRKLKSTRVSEKRKFVFIKHYMMR